MNITEEVPVRSLQFFEPDPNAVYSIEAAAQLARVGRHTILVYCRHGMVSPVVDPQAGGYYFNDEGIRTLRRIEHLQDSGINLAGIKIITDLMKEVERLRAEVHF